ncbi:MAG: Type 4 prepilin-like protein leader peptide-processing enzyme [Candidatus Uhrbacteria bacterium GW2011_GWD1_41_16]|uniref:Type 4 prepilin-like protein leader peptide-processing enzyme n=1 Tax=Candidatus Uhrbacteria bacterium GW2011_GWC1_41_20 TaxID=1618983 RepID=A0A0G0VEX1_9BACT|nr:MAG: Type 4 prepilin-like protein leader peptide-processing enzyme [Candidatus Uhrbacteria bacterium GW2011_GWE1_39_46]KKR63136.1 MAG: Type 4 prepilin-like protein leader peptide-processing enzyme [Candidatus Uhrbacteria bacterium GW2011_GWC2_40_450]KKR94450.1 MAG: Type 4 prepilin-like protein leader peptide-processing enzyme [Candidatus Uhrbacteria bacterium GW2011_GWD1_41_16]KKR98196.1 MAG: Type 4 prepilin-like protein leader peptide-processing enzyme [Candidatus Uhrbacteria bacterium GW201
MDWITNCLSSFSKEELGVVAVVFAFLIGCAFGSAILCAFMRIGKGQTWARGRSKCDVCNKELTWDQLIPIISFIIHGGRCKMCQTKLSWIYPVSEFIAGVIFAGIIYMFFH